MIHKICLISFVLIFVCLYLYVKIESFADPIVSLPSITTQPPPQTTAAPVPISTQLTTEIARVLGISIRRITNIKFAGDIMTGKLQSSFSILDANYSETLNNEQSATDAGVMANNLITTNMFIVNINGFSVKLSNMIPTPTIPNDFFNNKGLLDIATYAKNKYNVVPIDASLTNFYTLNITPDYNIAPTIANI